MYAAGIPVGLLVDAKGPRPGVLLGSITMGAGYLGVHQGMALQTRERLLAHDPISLRTGGWLRQCSLAMFLYIHCRCPPFFCCHYFALPQNFESCLGNHIDQKICLVTWQLPKSEKADFRTWL